MLNVRNWQIWAMTSPRQLVPCKMCRDKWTKDGGPFWE